MMMQTRSWIRVAGLTGVVFASLGVGAVAHAVQGGTAVTPVVDVGSYPPPLPDGCPDGAAAFSGLAFSNGRGDIEGSLADLDVRGGDQIRMSWDGLVAGCTDAQGGPAMSVTLAAYDTPGVGFDPAVDQWLLDGWASCGANAGPCTVIDGRGGLTFVVPGADVSCIMQIDAVLGAPLGTVGPSGSFFSAVLRGDDRPNMLVSSTGLEIVPCEVAVAPSATTPPATVATTPDTVAATTAPPAALPGTITAPTVVVPAQAVLPFTGAHTANAVALAAGCMLIGTALVLVATRSGRRRPA